jgi:hypothetical protein
LCCFFCWWWITQTTTTTHPPRHRIAIWPDKIIATWGQARSCKQQQRGQVYQIEHLEDDLPVPGLGLLHEQSRTEVQFFAQDMRVRVSSCARTYLIEAIGDASLHAKEDRDPMLAVIRVRLRAEPAKSGTLCEILKWGLFY